MIKDLEELTKKVSKLYNRFGTVQSIIEADTFQEIRNDSGKKIGEIRLKGIELTIEPAGYIGDAAFAEGKAAYWGKHERLSPYAPLTIEGKNKEEIWLAGYDEAKAEAEILANE